MVIRHHNGVHDACAFNGHVVVNGGEAFAAGFANMAVAGRTQGIHKRGGLRTPPPQSSPEWFANPSDCEHPGHVAHPSCSRSDGFANMTGAEYLHDVHRPGFLRSRASHLAHMTIAERRKTAGNPALNRSGRGIGGLNGVRTHDLSLRRRTLYPLSYKPVCISLLYTKAGRSETRPPPPPPSRHPDPRTTLGLWI